MWLSTGYFIFYGKKAIWPTSCVVKLLEAKMFIQKYLDFVQDAGLSFQEIGALTPDYLEANGWEWHCHTNNWASMSHFRTTVGTIYLSSLAVSKSWQPPWQGFKGVKFGAILISLELIYLRKREYKFENYVIVALLIADDAVSKEMARQ